MSENSFTETTSTGWFSRIGNSIKGILVGLIMVVIAFPVLFWNEGRAVKTRKDLNQGAKDFVMVDAAKVDASNDGKLVHFSGMAEAEGKRKDEVLNVKAEALVLRRNVEMYQWYEDVKTEKKKKLGGGEEVTNTYSYSKKWAEGRIDSSKFKKPGGRDNPALPISSQRWVASPITVGEYELPESLVVKINQVGALSLDGVKKLPKELAGRKLKKSGDTLYLAKDPGSPEVGDVRINYEVVNPTVVSVISKQKGNKLEPFQGDAGTSIHMLQVGEHSAEAMFESAQQSNKVMTWILRAVGFFVMFFGFNLIFKPLSVVADVLPIAGSIVGAGTGLVAFLLAAPLSLITIAVAWVFYRPLIGVPLLILAGVGLFFLIKKLRENRANAA